MNSRLVGCFVIFGGLIVFLATAFPILNTGVFTTEDGKTQLIIIGGISTIIVYAIQELRALKIESVRKQCEREKYEIELSIILREANVRHIGIKSAVVFVESSPFLGRKFKPIAQCDRIPLPPDYKPTQGMIEKVIRRHNPIFEPVKELHNYKDLTDEQKEDLRGITGAVLFRIMRGNRVIAIVQFESRDPFSVSDLLQLGAFADLEGCVRIFHSSLSRLVCTRWQYLQGGRNDFGSIS